MRTAIREKPMYFEEVLSKSCSSSDERDSRTHLLSGKAPLLVLCGAADGYNFLIRKFAGQSSVSLKEFGRELSRNGPEGCGTQH